VKLHAFILGAAIAAAMFGLYALAGALFLFGVAVLPLPFEPTRCNQNCRQGRDCNCCHRKAAGEAETEPVEDFA
jgi:hypothetical protein